MATFEVGVWVTQKQYDDTGTEVLNRVAAYLEDAVSNHTINAYTNSDHPDAPTENPCESFSTVAPCTTSTESYSNLTQWWIDYHSCNNLTEYADSNLLVTDYNEYGPGKEGPNDKFASANGYAIENLSDGQNYDNGNDAYNMNICLMEVGHNLISGVSDSDGDGHSEHDTCVTRIHWVGPYESHTYITPMGQGYNNKHTSAGDELDGENECGEAIASENEFAYADFNYADCAESYMG